MNLFKPYKPRTIEFHQYVRVDGWTVKVYTITNRSSFASKAVLATAMQKLSEWLTRASDLDHPKYNSAFLVVHEGVDGVWTLINWWLGGEMLQSHTFFTDYEKPDTFVEVLKTGFMACVWEMEVIAFERAMWIEHVLKKATRPDIESYLNEQLRRATNELPHTKRRTAGYGGVDQALLGTRGV